MNPIAYQNEAIIDAYNERCKEIATEYMRGLIQSVDVYEHRIRVATKLKDDLLNAAYKAECENNRETMKEG